MSKFRSVLKSGMKLASDGATEDASEQLERGLAEAMVEGSHSWVAKLSKQAAVLAEQQGKLNKAKRLYRISAENDTSDPYLHLALGEICQRLGQKHRASRYFASGFKLAVESNNTEFVSLLTNRGYVPPSAGKK